MQTAQQFGIDPSRGFLPANDPLKSLPSTFEPWEEVAAYLPKLFASNHLRLWVEQMPLLDSSSLQTAVELERAMLMLSYIGHSYLWCLKTPPPHFPAPLAVPWQAIAERLHRPPVLSYASYALNNWQRLDGSQEVALGNIALQQNFLGGVDEEWFVLIHIDIEAKAAPAILALIDGQNAVTQQRPEILFNSLEIIHSALQQMNQILARMPEHCDPYIYYTRVRPYINGWKSNPAVPQGMIYEGVTAYGGSPQQFRGETGAQSTIIPALDAFFGIKHEQDLLFQHLQEMRNYMPKGHREFLEFLESQGGVRDFIIAQAPNTPSLKDVYNSCIEEIDLFRKKHLEYASSYIEKQNQSWEGNPTAVGTGGTPFMKYLLKHQQTTLKHLL